MQTKIFETCACGGSFQIESDMLPLAALDVVGAWRATHACAKRERPATEAADWQAAHVGSACGACGAKLTDAKGLTTVSGRPVHIACRACSWCGRTQPWEMRWLDEEGFEGDGLIHVRRCLKQRKAAETATEVSDGDDGLLVRD